MLLSLKSARPCSAGDLVAASASPALMHGPSSNVCEDCHHAPAEELLSLRDVGPVLGMFEDTAQGLQGYQVEKPDSDTPGCDTKTELPMQSPL